jgi:hypothetical protein
MRKKTTPQEYRKEILRKGKNMDYRTRLLKARDAYFGKIQNSTIEDNIQAQISGGSMAEAELTNFLDLDFTDEYNWGETPEEFSEPARSNFKEFIKAFDLPYPNGKEPKEEFELPEE